jgi:hypothetical protein
VKPFVAQTHYEVLEVSVGATLADIRSAYERLMRLYSEEQVALYGLVDGGRAEALRQRLGEALAVLSDDRRRDAYDRTLGLPPREGALPASKPVASAGGTSWGGWGNVSYAYVSTAPAPVASAAPVVYLSPAPSTPQPVPTAPMGVPTPPAVPPAPQAAPPSSAPFPVVDIDVSAIADAPPAEPVADASMEVAIVPSRTVSREHRPLEPKPKPYDIPAGVEFNGDLLRQVRLARGLSLVQLSERTRISVKHLELVEGDRYDGLPATVYLRGILMSVARELGLDGLAVVKSYLAFVDAHRSKG